MLPLVRGDGLGKPLAASRKPLAASLHRTTPQDAWLLDMHRALPAPSAWMGMDNQEQPLPCLEARRLSVSLPHLSGQA